MPPQIYKASKSSKSTLSPFLFLICTLQLYFDPIQIRSPPSIMMNKRIPDWLNSSLWSAHPPHDDAATAEPPPPVPPPAAERSSQPSMSSPDAKQQSRNPLSSVSENYASACCSDEEDSRSSENSTAPAAKDVSRQNQILNEVFGAGFVLIIYLFFSSKFRYENVFFGGKSVKTFVHNSLSYFSCLLVVFLGARQSFECTADVIELKLEMLQNN